MSHTQNESDGAAAPRGDGRRAEPAIDSAFLAGMAHELRTPLAAIGGYAELLSHGVQGPVTPQQVDGLQRIKRNQQLMVSLVASVMDYVSAISGRVDVSLGPVTLAPAVERVANELAARLRERSVTLHVDAGVAPVEVSADPTRLHDVLRHLLVDALETTPPDGRVDVRILPPTDGEPVSVVVRGGGEALDDATTEAVFRPFDRAGRAGRPPHALDLPLARALARVMGGELVAAAPRSTDRAFTLQLQRASAG